MKEKIKSQRSLKRRQKSAPVTGVVKDADTVMVDTALIDILHQDSIKAKRKTEKEALTTVAGEKPGISEILQQYDAQVNSEDDGGASSSENAETREGQSKESIVAFKSAQKQLDQEIRKQQQLKEQMKVSNAKQVNYFVLVPITAHSKYS